MTLIPLSSLLRVTIISLCVIGLVSACQRSTPLPSSGKLNVSASFYPLAFFAEQIGGQYANVTNLTPAGAEPHDYEPTPQEIAILTNSNLLIINGGGLEIWYDKIKDSLDPKRTAVVVAGQGLTALKMDEVGLRQIDPHVWLSPPLAQQMVEAITKGFIAKDATHATYYQDNAEKLKLQLAALGSAFQQGLANCKQNTFVTSHAAFGYLASAYALTQLPITGLSPDAEPSARELADIADFAKQHGVKYIFSEELVSPKLSETIAREVGAQTLELSPLEGLSEEDSTAGQNYFTVMEHNLAQLRLALECR